ncbi:MAG: arsenate reductase family protein [Bacteroidales bacterium]
MFKIYHNPRCKKSREGLKYLTDRKIDFQLIDYIKNPLTKDELKKLLMKLNAKPEEIIRVQEEYYKKELKGKNFTPDEWIEIIAENPKLIQRPIVEGRYKAVVACPPNKVEGLLNQPQTV